MWGRAQISAPEGLKRFAARYPSLKVVGHVSYQFRLAQVSLTRLFRLRDGLTMVSMSELISFRDLGTLASAGAPYLVV